MAYRTQIVRMAKWINNTQGKSIAAKTTGLLPSMQAQMVTWTGRIVNVEQSTKIILAEAGLSSIFNPWYLTFSRKIMSLRDKFRGAQLMLMADAELSNWVGRGLDRDILERIRNSVWTLDAPGA